MTVLLVCFALVAVVFAVGMLRLACAWEQQRRQRVCRPRRVGPLEVRDRR